MLLFVVTKSLSGNNEKRTKFLKFLFQLYYFILPLRVVDRPCARVMHFVRRLLSSEHSALAALVAERTLESARLIVARRVEFAIATRAAMWAEEMK